MSIYLLFVFLLRSCICCSRCHFWICSCLIDAFSVCLCLLGYRSLGHLSLVLWWRSSKSLTYLFSGQFFFSTGWCFLYSPWGNRFSIWSNTDMFLSLSANRYVFFFFCFTFAYLTSWVMVFVTFCPWLLLLAEIWKETGSSREQWMIKSTVQVFSFLLIARSFVSDWVRRNDQSDTLVACLRQVFFVVALLSSSWLWTGFTWKQCILLIQFFVSENNVFCTWPFRNHNQAFWCILVLKEGTLYVQSIFGQNMKYLRWPNLKRGSQIPNLRWPNLKTKESCVNEIAQQRPLDLLNGWKTNGLN